MLPIEKDRWPLFRLVVPAFPALNIFTRAASKTTSLGPISVATSADKVWGWRVEVIDENNFKGPRNQERLPDHEKLQDENPATVVGLYCGLSSTMDRVFELARFYRRKNVSNIAGGWHAHYSPKEVLDNDVDIVVHGDGELVIRKLLIALKEGADISGIPDISFWKEGRQITNSRPAGEAVELSQLPYPNFGLLRYAKKLKTYPIGRTRGCRMTCEFCSVKGTPRSASAKHLFETVKWLVETKRAKRFFIVDDRLEEDFKGTLDFFRMIKERYGDTLFFTVQIRLEVAGKTAFLLVMKQAGVRIVCVGYESPIDENLEAMNKRYRSRDMLEWTKALRKHFWVHGMFIFGYPGKEQSCTLDATEMAKEFKRFIRRAKLSSLQVLHPVPIVGSDLRTRLQQENRVFPLEVVPWSRYDGSYTCFKPDDNMTIAEHQETPIRIMRWFYSPLSVVGIALRTITFPLHYPFAGWRAWHDGWLRHVIKFGGHRLLRRWQKLQHDRAFTAKLLEYTQGTQSNAQVTRVSRS